MLYMANFSFESYGPNPQYGYFTYMVEEDNVQLALKETKRNIRTFHDDSSLFKGRYRIYLNQILEITKIPGNGIMTHLSIHSGACPDSIGCPLPSQDVTGVTAYSPTKETEQSVRTADLPPFMEFDD